MPQLREAAAQQHAAQRIAVANATTAVADQAWRQVDPDNIVASWTEQLPLATAAVTRGQYAAALTADSYVDDFDLAGAGVEDDVAAASFAGVASDGRNLVDLLMSPAFQALQVIAGGGHPHDALQSGGRHLDMIVQTQVADAGRLADGTALTAHRRLDGYIRVVAGGACSRCTILSGRWYRWNASFLRHPHCHCVGMPAQHDVKVPDPRRLYDSMTAQQRQRAGWSHADQQAIADGADLSQVTNAHRGVYSAGGKRYTREGTSRRGLFGGYRVDPETGQLMKRTAGEVEKVPGQRVRVARQRRLTPDQIYADASADRDAAIRMLRENGYLKPVARPATAVRPRLAEAASEAGPAAEPGVPVPQQVRDRLAGASTTDAVNSVFTAEAHRITGRRITADLQGSVDTAREHAEGVLRGLERFPDTQLTRISTADLSSPTAYARAAQGEITFAQSWSAEAGRTGYLESAARTERPGKAGTTWHPKGTGNPVAVAIHEFGHVLDIDTLGRAAQRDVSRILLRRAADADLSVDELIQREVSQYASRNERELVAEAFADVLVNGEAASQLSREIVDAVNAEYRRTGRRIVHPRRPPTEDLSEPAPIAAAAREFHRGLDGIEDLAAAVEEGAAGKGRALTGGSVGDTRLVELKDGQRVVHKSARTLDAKKAREQADAEQAVSMLAQALGLHAPRVYRNEARAVWMDYIDRPSVMELWQEAPDQLEAQLRHQLATAIDSDQGVMAGLLDLMIANGDRHTGNWLLQDGEAVLIDHGNAFSSYRMYGPITPPISVESIERLFTSTTRGPFARNFATSEIDDEASAHWIDNRLTFADIAEVRRRLAALEPDFEHLDRRAWIDYAYRVLDAIEPHALGTRNLIAGG